MVSWGKLVTQPFIRVETKGNSNDMVANCFFLTYLNLLPSPYEINSFIIVFVRVCLYSKFLQIN